MKGTELRSAFANGQLIGDTILDVNNSIPTWEGKRGRVVRALAHSVVLEMTTSEGTFQVHFPWEQVSLHSRGST